MHNYGIIKAPILTEKANTLIQHNVYVLKVAKDSNKVEIKKAVEHFFNVKVKSIQTSNSKPKNKRVGRFTGKTKEFKKAYVTLQDGYKIEIN